MSLFDPTATATQVGDGAIMPPAVPASGEELYDQIMGAIEPELTTAMLPLLKEKYANETPDEAKVRAERYATAFQEYRRLFDAHASDWAGQLQRFTKGAWASQERAAADDDKGDAMTNLDTAIANT